MSTICPVCERLVLEPSPALLRTAKWGECACTDDGPCVAHQYDPTDMPQRPDPKTLMRRVAVEHDRRMQHYERMCERIAAATSPPGYRTVQISATALRTLRLHRLGGYEAPSAQMVVDAITSDLSAWLKEMPGE